MDVIRERIEAVERGGILYDASQLRKPEPAWFTRQHWSDRGLLTEVTGGRGSVSFLRTEAGGWVLRHYRRGGLIARICHDGYLWLGESRTRSFAEWRLLAELRRRDLPVPAPVAARYIRSGLIYRADLITAELPASRTLAAAIAESLTSQQWNVVGATIARFHAHGVHHADLNAHNILLAADGRVFVLDFDRGRIRSRGAWEERVLARLRHSLEKIRGQRSDTHFDEACWQALMSGYRGEEGTGGR